MVIWKRKCCNSTGRNLGEQVLNQLVGQKPIGITDESKGYSSDLPLNMDVIPMVDVLSVSLEETSIAQWEV